MGERHRASAAVGRLGDAALWSLVLLAWPGFPALAGPLPHGTGRPEPVEGPPRADPADQIGPLVERMNAYFHGHEVDGVTMDSRYAINPPEAIRMSVICQLLGYAELYEVTPSLEFRADIGERADFLLGRLDEIRSHTTFDGMLGLSLLAAFDVTHDPRHWDAAATVLEELMAIPTSQCILNGGLMVAMATAHYARLTGDAEAAQKTRDILASLLAYQHRDGSFPHWCICSKDIHYTGWMAMELILIERITHEPSIGPMLERMSAFLEARVDSTGKAHYEDPCPGVPGCTEFFYSRATGCGYDYDTRGWTVEPGYTVLLFDRFRSPELPAVVDFLLSLENGGTFPDLYAYWPPPEDPEYPWTNADTSVANMSIIFWSLAAIVSGRQPGDADPIGPLAPGARLDRPRPAALTTKHAVPFTATPAGGEPPSRWSKVDRLFLAGANPAQGCEEALRAAEPATGSVRLGPVVPNPARDACVVRFRLAAPREVRLSIVDAAGRRVREMALGTLGAGEHAARWDRRDDAGRPCASGLYFLRLRGAKEAGTARVVVTK